MLNYIYYRSYCFYEKNKLAIEPHTYAIAIPLFIETFIIFLTYYFLLVQNVIPFIKINGWLYAIILICIYFLNDKFFSGKINSYKVRWRIESPFLKLVKGIIITISAVASFSGIFIIANLLHELRV
ncbi:MAG: hypothetical protein SFU87_21055 [Chitinophagaceae bacterium]|nr:hypothetical protein [Chitinophagaceae bacterium]